MAVVHRVLLVFVLALLQWPAAALAQSYPAKPVRVIVVFPPGGSNDAALRKQHVQGVEQVEIRRLHEPTLAYSAPDATIMCKRCVFCTDRGRGYGLAMG